MGVGTTWQPNPIHLSAFGGAGMSASPRAALLGGIAAIVPLT